MKQIQQSGFTLIELMIVVAIISILSTMALPSFQDRVIRNQIIEGFNLAEIAKDAVEGYYREKQKMPESNAEAGLPVPEKIIGNYVTSISVESGVITITLGNRINANVTGKTVTIRPAIVKDEPIVPIAWVYAYASVPDKMVAIGSNSSTVQPRHLPVNCRY